MKISQIVSAAAGHENLDVVIKNVNMVNVFTCEVYKADIGIYGDRIVNIDADGSFELQADLEIDGAGKWAIPGLIDPHLHIETTMVTPANYAAAVLPHGVTTAVIDPHEMGNVLGKEGVRFMIDGSEGLPLRVLITIPSCVPSIPGSETAGASFDADDIREMFSWDRVVGLGEVMDFIGVANGEKRIIDIVQAGADEEVYLQGHAPMMSGRALQAYVAAGIHDDHEMISGQECIEKMRLGIKPLLRVLSENHNLQEIVPEIKQLPFFDEVGICTDDIFPDISLNHGHMDFAIREVIANGIDPVKAIRWATINNARVSGLKQIGAIAPGYSADIVLLSSLEDVVVTDVVAAGELIVKDGGLVRSISDPTEDFAINNSVILPELTKESFSLDTPTADGDVEMNVLMVSDIEIAPFVVRKTVNIKNGVVDLGQNDEIINLLTVVPRHGQTHKNVVVPASGLNISNGALATTISHDSHNLIVAGSDPQNMLVAVNELQECGGGIVAVKDGKVVAKLELPIAGLLSTKSIYEVAEELDAVNKATSEIGMREFKPSSAVVLNYLALIVIPVVRVSDLGGLFDVQTNKFIPVFP